MTTIITRLYESEAIAGDVVAALERRGFGDLDYTVVASEGAAARERTATTSPAEPAPAGDGETSAEGETVEAQAAPDTPAAPAPPDPAEREAIAERVRAAGVPRRLVHGLVEKVLAGNVLVVVAAPFGFAKIAEDVLESFPVVRPEAAPARVYRPTRGSTARYTDGPFPSLLPPGSLFMTGPVSGSLTRKPEPFESSFGVQLIIRPSGRPNRTRIPRTPPFTRAIPIPLLWRRRAKRAMATPADPPVSARLGLPILLDRKGLTPGRLIHRRR